MQTTYNGEHSIIFGDKHSWEDWGLVPTSLPVVSMPSVNTNMLEIPGMSGKLDLTDVPLGYPTYSTRNGSWTFYVAHDITGLTWEQTYAMISSYLHGRRRKCILLDDRSYYYIGRFSIKSDKLCSQITINYELDPFKWMRWSTCDDWPWNPFDFIYGEITQDYFKDINVAQTFHDVWTQNEIGAAPVIPTFTIRGGAFNNESHVFAITVTNSVNGSSHTINGEIRPGFVQTEIIDPLLEMSCPNPEDEMSILITNGGYTDHGSLSVSIDFTPGRL